MRFHLASLILPVLTLVIPGCGDGDGESTGPSSTGNLQVTLVMTGEDLDSDGCQFAVDAVANRTLLAGESTTFSGLLPGSHVVQISGVAPNCQVQGDQLRAATVSAGQTTAVTFAVTCESTLGAIEVTAVTSGNDIDPDGYAVSVDGGTSQSIGTDGTVMIGGLNEGTHSVELSGLAANCEAGDNPRAVTVSAQQTTATTFQVECLRLLNDRIVFLSNRTGQNELFVVDPDGSNLEQITSLGLSLGSLSVSPDGTRIAVMAFLDGSFEIAVVSSNGTGLVNLTQDPSVETSPDWSPDGTRIAFASERSGLNAVWVMNADGSNPVNVSGQHGADPSWSPDGMQIAFSTNRDGDVEVYSMNSDGSGQVNLTNNLASDHSPAWSPDGLWIAFTSDRDGDADIMIMGAGGGGAANVTGSPTAFDEAAGWSPDGARVVFYSNLHDPNEFVPDIYTVETNGTNQFRLTSGPSSDQFPDWGPSR